MEKVLLLYATREGQTEKVATRIARHLTDAGARVTLVNARDKSLCAAIELGTYDYLVFGASMHAGGLEKELVDFINHRRDGIALKRRSLFLVLLSAATRDSDLRAAWLRDARTKMDQQLCVRFDSVEMIAGALRYSQYSRPVKWMMKRIALQAGEGTDTSKDYEYTDWYQVERYAQSLSTDG